MVIARRKPAMWLGLCLVAAFCTATAGADTAPLPLAFATHGGEAWTFHKRVEIIVREGACEQVAVTSPAASLLARPEKERVLASVPLLAGDNLVSAECRNAGIRQGEPITQHWLVRLRDVPKARANVHLGEGGIILDAGASEPAPTRPTPIVRYAWNAANGNPAPVALPIEGQRIAVATPGIDGEYRLTLTVVDESGRTDRSTIMFRVRAGEPIVPDGMRDTPAWTDAAVIYGVIPSAFDPPRLAAVAARLDALRTLGINTLWLSPITASPPGDFGYAVTDHFSVREEIGSETDLRALVAAAHARDMRVILDFVPNHLSDRHPYYLDADVHGRTSPYFEFFARTPSGEAAYYFDWRNLKNLNYDHPEVQRMIIEASSYWVRALDIDGFRVDVAWGPRERAPDFWPRWREELKRIKPDLFLLAEASALDTYYVGHGFDAAYDWTDRLGVWAWSEAFAEARTTARRLREALASDRNAGQTRIFRFLNNNDTGARFITRHGAPKTRVAAAMLLTLPGIPGLYTGDEVGAEFEPYNRRAAIPWDDVHGLRAWYAALLRLRRDVPALRSHGLRVIEMAPASGILAYLRPGKDRQGGVLVLLNYGSEPAEVSIPESVTAEIGEGPALVDLLDRGSFVTDGRRVRLAAYGVRILQSR